MDLVLAGLQMTHCLVYIDDMIVVGRSFDNASLQYMRRVQTSEGSWTEAQT